MPLKQDFLVGAYKWVDKNSGKTFIQLQIDTYPNDMTIKNL